MKSHGNIAAILSSAVVEKPVCILYLTFYLFHSHVWCVQSREFLVPYATINLAASESSECEDDSVSVKSYNHVDDWYEMCFVMFTQCTEANKWRRHAKHITDCSLPFFSAFSTSLLLWVSSGRKLALHLSIHAERDIVLANLSVSCFSVCHILVLYLNSYHHLVGTGL